MSGSKVIHVLSGAEYDLYIGRAMPRQGLAGSFWANPFKADRDGSLSEVLAFYETYARKLHERSGYYEQHIEHLGGLTLACWCPNKQGGVLTLDDAEICHGQVLLRLAREYGGAA